MSAKPCRDCQSKNERIAQLQLENSRLKLGGLSPLDYQRLVTWMRDHRYQPAITAFTAGAARDCARAFEEATKENHEKV